MTGLPRTAATVAVTSWAITLVSAAILLLARPQATGDLWFYAVDAMVGCVYGLVAGIVLSRRRHPVPGVLALTALGGAVAAFGFAYATLGLTEPDLPGLAEIGRLNGIAWVPGTLAMFLVVPWLVREHPLGPLERVGLALGIACCAWFTLARLLDLTWSMLWFAGPAVIVGVLTTLNVAWRWRHGPLAERVGLGWLTIGTAIMTASFVPIALPPSSALPIWLVPALHLTAQAFFPAAVLVAVLRQRLWGIDLVVSRAVLAGLLTVVLVVGYAIITAVVAGLLPSEGAGQLVAAAAVVVAVQPSRLWLQRRVHGLVHGPEPDRAVQQLGRHLSSASTPDELVDGLVGGVADALRLESVTLVVDGHPQVSRGSATSGPVVVPLVHRGAEVGELWVTAPPGESLGSRSTRTLQEQSAVVAAGVALALAARDLDDARDRLTSVRMHERRVIRRELHDGLGPSLAGIRLGLQAARNLVPTDPGAAVELLASLQAELDTRVDDVRQLSRNLLPPVLDELGLAAALTDLAQRVAGTGLDVEVRVEVPAERLAQLDRERAAASYGIAAEAVTNVVRHSGARRCEVVVDQVDGRLRLVVLDDGNGRDPQAPAGVGTRSMRERAEEQGGTLDVGSGPSGGTRVEARLPWRTG
jgi:signal transduction histidine kinase